MEGTGESAVVAAPFAAVAPEIAAARARLAELAARDREVRAHQRAHLEAGRPHMGPARFAFERGPDGRRYAVAGEVAVDARPVRGDPEATAAKMRVIARAALAPAEPSVEDRRLAAWARAELARALAVIAAARAPAAGATHRSVRV